MLNKITINAGQTLEYFDPGDFFRIMEADGPVTVVFYRNGAEISEAESVSEGYAERFRGQGFDRYTIFSATTQVLQIVARDGADVAYDRPPVGTITGTVELGATSLAALETINVVDVAGAFTQAQATVTTTNGQLLAATATRAYLLIQNNDAAGIVYVTLNGAAATTTNGIKLSPGASLELANHCPNGAINAIGSIASNANVIVVQG